MRFRALFDLRFLSVSNAARTCVGWVLACQRRCTAPVSTSDERWSSREAKSVNAKASQRRRDGGLVGQRGDVLREGDLAAERGRERGQRRPHSARVPPGLHEPARARAWVR